jgi:hypothetical protein
MAEAIRQIWKDAVGSKLIAWIIQGFIVAVLLPTLYLAWENLGGLPAILLTVGIIVVIVLASILVWKVLNRSKPKIERVGDVDVNFDKTAFYPLKCWVQLRNAAAECADVRIINYAPQKVYLKKFHTNVLQLKLDNEWYPPKGGRGVEHIPVLPGQLFQAWVGVNEEDFNMDQVRALRGQIGTLIFQVNGKRLDLDI